MNDAEQRAAAKKFADYWEGKGYEKGDTSSFWIAFLSDVMGIDYAPEYINFEKEVMVNGNTKFIDAYIPATRVMIEQKSLDKSLNKALPQSGGKLMTPYEQAKNYANNLPVSEVPRWIITCNFREFQIYNMEKPGEAPTSIMLKELPKRYSEFGFLIDHSKEEINHETEVSIKAGDLVGKIYDAFLSGYTDEEKEDEAKLHSLNVLCVRLVFCLYAEDAGIFGKRDMFHDYLASYNVENMDMALAMLFSVLDTPEDERGWLPIKTDKLLAFPYVNGGLFDRNENVQVPEITQEIADLLLNKASMEFDWSEISPTIFGAVFESTLNPETRRSGGMHYTSIENIHKLIDPLFLDDLKGELSSIKAIATPNTRRDRLKAYQEKLASLTWLDPAAGSGNFLTETYLCIRRLENEVIGELIGMEKGQAVGQIVLGFENANPIRVSIHQFYGIEINDFAVTVARTALWIAESQMLKETEDVVRMQLDFLPLKTYVNIVQGNALRIDWNDIIPSTKLNYIMGNPPFIANTGRISDAEQHSKKTISDDQEDDRLELFGKEGGLLDYVACWYKVSESYMKGTHIKAAYVSTDSITQGQQVAPLWKPLMSSGINILFAHRSFKWSNDSNEKSATVYVVIIGFSYDQAVNPALYHDGVFQKASHINAYLQDAPDVFVESRNKPICNVPPMASGGKPVEGGNLILTKDEKDLLIQGNPNIERFIRAFVSGESYINNKPQYCLWLVDATPNDLTVNKEIRERIAKVREFRLNSKKAATRKCAETPHLFMEIKQPDSDYLIIPLTTSRNRRYVPIGYLGKDVIANNGASFVPDATLYHFGVLTSNVHMGWMRAVCGYFGPSYRYSNKIVYNNFPWPTPSNEQMLKIEETAQGILDARKQYPDSSLAALYNELTMPQNLRNAHRANDRAVWEAYGKAWNISSESECVAFLMKEYQRLTTKDR